MAHVPEERQSDRQQDALLDADRDNCRRGDDGKIKLARAFAANIAQTLYVDHPERDRKHDAGQHAARQILERAGQEQQHQQHDACKYQLCDWLRAPARSAMAVCVGLPLTTNVPLTAATAFAADSPRMSRPRRRVRDNACANARDVAALCAMIITKHEAATGSSARTSLQVTSGSPIGGSPPGTGPMTAMPRSAKWNAALAAIVPTTANSETGNRGATRLPIRILPATSTDSANVGRLDLRQGLQDLPRLTERAVRARP